jgi:hypothetical protein
MVETNKHHENILDCCMHDIGLGVNLMNPEVPPPIKALPTPCLANLHRHSKSRR